MKRSIGKIVTSHVGALPRPPALGGQYASKGDAEEITLGSAIVDVVGQQAGCGLDLVNDGEFSKYSFIQYATERLSGFHEVELPPHVDPGASVAGRDLRAFPGYYADRGGVFPFKVKAFACQDATSYVGQEATAADIANLKSGLTAHSLEPTDGFLTAISPVTLQVLLPSFHHESDEAYLYALADALHDEYKQITDAGLNLQIDDPGLAHAWQKYPDWSVADCRRFCESRIEALNHALRDCPEEQVRLHVCWGTFSRPLPEAADPVPLQPVITSTSLKEPGHEIGTFLRLSTGPRLAGKRPVAIDRCRARRWQGDRPRASRNRTRRSLSAGRCQSLAQLQSDRLSTIAGQSRSQSETYSNLAQQSTSSAVTTIRTTFLSVNQFSVVGHKLGTTED